MTSIASQFYYKSMIQIDETASSHNGYMCTEPCRKLVKPISGMRALELVISGGWSGWEMHSAMIVYLWSYVTELTRAAFLR